MLQADPKNGTESSFLRENVKENVIFGALKVFKALQNAWPIFPLADDMKHAQGKGIQKADPICFSLTSSCGKWKRSLLRENVKKNVICGALEAL